MNKELLLKLADHLEFGKLGHKIFDFSSYNNSCVSECGTTGCAIGECPILFPRDWSWSYLGNPIYKGNGGNTYSAAMGFFELTKLECDFLFYPNLVYQDHFGCPLPPTATRFQVAMHIKKFVREGGVYWRKPK